MVRAILLTHGTLGASLMASVESILGPQIDVTVLSNSGLSLDQIIASLSPHIMDQPCIVFAELAETVCSDGHRGIQLHCE